MVQADQAWVVQAVLVGQGVFEVLEALAVQGVWGVLVGLVV